MSKAKKIIIVSNSCWNIYNFRLPLIKHLTRCGHHVIIACVTDQYQSYLHSIPNIRLIFLDKLHPTSRNPLNILSSLNELFNLYKKEKPDLILHFTIKPNIIGSIAAYFAKSKSISIITGLGYTFINPGFTNTILPFLYKIAFKKIDKLIVYNPDDGNYFVKNKIIPTSKITAIMGSGVNTSYFAPIPKTRVNGKLVFVFIGRLLIDKGVREFVEAATIVKPMHNNAEFWLAGAISNNPSSIQEMELNQWIKAGDIRYLGHVDDVRDVIAAADVAVLPSYREGIPKAILEALAMGKPVITTDEAGCRETVEHGVNGFLVPVKSTAGLAEAMHKMFAMPVEALEVMGQNSRARALRLFDEKIILQAYSKAINEVL